MRGNIKKNVVWLPDDFVSLYIPRADFDERLAFLIYIYKCTVYSYLSHKSLEFGVQFKNMPGILMYLLLDVSFETHTLNHIHTIRLKCYPNSSSVD